MEISQIKNEIKQELYNIKSEIKNSLNSYEFENNLTTTLENTKDSSQNTDTLTVDSDLSKDVTDTQSSLSKINNSLDTLINLLTENKIPSTSDNNLYFANNVYQIYTDLTNITSDKEPSLNPVINESKKENTTSESVGDSSNINGENNNAITQNPPSNNVTNPTTNESTNSTTVNTSEKVYSYSSLIKDISSSSKNKVTTAIANAVKKAASTYNVDEKLILKVIETESNFNPNVSSGVGAQGLMQLMPATAKSLGVSNSLNIEENVMGGTKYLSQMLSKYNNDVKLSLAAYNAGPGNVNKYNGVPPFKETQNYVNKILL